MFTEEDKKQIIARGSSLEGVEKQIEKFVNGFPPLRLEKPAKEGSGILISSGDEQERLQQLYDKLSSEISIVKFVPASGAASRMFKSLFGFMESYQGSEQEYEDFSNGKSYPDAFKFFKQIHDFAYYEDLKEAFARSGVTLEEAHLRRQYVEILKVFLTTQGLNYGGLPKGLLKFHQYGEGNRTAAEEHLVEGAHYARGKNDLVKLHFTVSPEHRARFSEHINEVKGKYEKEFGVTYEVSYSEQKPSTDTIAVDLDDQPFRNSDGTLLFRPAGHGALVANLNEIDADLVFIKNIDNVVPDHLKVETYKFKKVIAGKLLELQQQVFDYLKKIDSQWDEPLCNEISVFLESSLNTVLPEGFEQLSLEEKKSQLHKKLNRPIRVSGMVGNIGDPGGGPFWARNSDGSVSLQIVETAQVNLNDTDQKSIFDQSTHFNPVDLVCGVRDYQGKKFDLEAYVDAQTGFITQKSKDGKDLKAQELPGLWNGTMSDWISVFVEVPVITFNPVKQVNNLLEPVHQPG